VAAALPPDRAESGGETPLQAVEVLRIINMGHVRRQQGSRRRWRTGKWDKMVLEEILGTCRNLTSGLEGLLERKLLRTSDVECDRDVYQVRVCLVQKIKLLLILFTTRS
jgi:hypothetical protein